MQVKIKLAEISAGSVRDGDIGPTSVRPLTEEAFVEDAVEQPEVDAVEEEEEEDVQVLKGQPMPRWYRRNQQGLDLRCNRYKSLLQCPVLNQDRETSCALPWPA